MDIGVVCLHLSVVVSVPTDWPSLRSRSSSYPVSLFALAAGLGQMFRCHRASVTHPAHVFIVLKQRYF